MSTPDNRQTKELRRYARQVANQAETLKARLEEALSLMDTEVQAIRTSLGIDHNVYADHAVAQAAKIQDAALQYRTAAEHALMLEAIISGDSETNPDDGPVGA